MIHINIINAYNEHIFMHQLDCKRFEGKIHFAENSHEDIIWDYIVVFQNLNHDFDNIKYRKGGLIFIAGEPECAEPYCKAFFNQFDYCIVPHPHCHYTNILHTNPALNWHFGRSYAQGCFKYNYNTLKTLPIPPKTLNVSMMCSNKQMMPGHVLRYKAYQLFKDVFAGKIDFFGSGIKLVDDKADILLPYRFHICIENSQDEHYWTEKIADSILGYSIPIYCGAPNITDYFPQKAIVSIDVNKPKEAIVILKQILSNPEEEYQKRLPALIEARNLLLDKYNIFPMLEDFIEKMNPQLGDVCTFSVKSYLEMYSWKILNNIARAKRLVFKLTHR